MTYVTSVQQDALYDSPDTAAVLLRSWLAPDVSTAERDKAMEDLSTVRRALQTDNTRQVWWEVTPLGTRVESVEPDRARVQVWVVAVIASGGNALRHRATGGNEEIAADGGYTPTATWTTVTVDLSWLDGRWWVWSVMSNAGPTPMLNNTSRPVTSDEFVHALDGFSLVKGHY